MQIIFILLNAIENVKLNEQINEQINDLERNKFFKPNELRMFGFY